MFYDSLTDLGSNDIVLKLCIFAKIVLCNIYHNYWMSNNFVIYTADMITCNRNYSSYHVSILCSQKVVAVKKKEASLQPPGIQSALLDGEYFHVTSIDSDKIRAVCEMCPKAKSSISMQFFLCQHLLSAYSALLE